MNNLGKKHNSKTNSRIELSIKKYNYDKKIIKSFTRINTAILFKNYIVIKLMKIC